MSSHITKRTEQSLEYNLDAAQRELDKRNAEGEDVSKLVVNPRTARIETAPADTEPTGNCPLPKVARCRLPSITALREAIRGAKEQPLALCGGLASAVNP